MSWDQRHMNLARHVATWSKDRSTKVGCVIVGPRQDVRATGFNGFPRGVDDNIEARHERPAKYKWTEHAERNAIYQAASRGTSLEGCTIYLPWFPCMDCGRAIVQSGIACIVAVEPDWQDKRWGDDFLLVADLFEEVDLEIRWYQDE